jgi:heme-degrading monooxygenase HmoA
LVAHREQKEERMAVVIVNEIEGGNEELYEQVNAKVMQDGTLPDGCQLHIAGPTEKGWRVITVWDSDDQFQQFRDEKLIPAVREAAGEERVAPNISSDPVHRLITA